MEQFNLFPSQWQCICSLDNLHLAYQKAKKGKAMRDDVTKFTFSLEQELADLHYELNSKTYMPSGYRQFSIYERKPRIISVAPFRDRVVHHALMNILEPIIDKLFIQETFACRKGKGVHAAVNYYQKHCGQFQYILKMDVKRYFPSVDHHTLKTQIRSIINDGNVLKLVDDIIDSNDADIGLPIGNLTSQVFANLYLHELDKMVVQNKAIRYFRYVDDLFILANDKNTLWLLYKKIVTLLAGLKLELHLNQTQIYRTNEKVDVLGYKVTKNKRWLRNENGHRFNRKLKRMAKHYQEYIVNFDDINPSVQSWIGHSQHAETEGLRTALFNDTVFQRE